MMDIEFKDIIIHNNTLHLTRNLDITVDEINRQLNKIEYTGVGNQKIKGFENSNVPPFIVAFYLFVLFKNKIPDEQQFLNTYITRFFLKKTNGEFTLREKYSKGYNCPDLSFKQLSTRPLRSYPSIIRDFHFYCLCKESNKFDELRYSLKDDYFVGHDLLVWKNNIKFAVDLFISSSRSMHFRKLKDSRHESTLTYQIELPLNPQNANNVNQFYLYDNKHITLLNKEIDNHLKV